VRWNPYIDLRCEVSKSARATCKDCGAPLEKGGLRAKAVDVLGREALLHLDCAAQKVSDIACRKIKEGDKSDWPAEGREQLARFLPDDATPSPRSFLRTPILDLSYAKDATGHLPCVYCGKAAPCDPLGPQYGHAVRAFSIDGERRFHPACIVQLAPGLCRRIALEDGERWPAEVKLFFKTVIPEAIQPTPRSPWKNTGGVPNLHRSPSGRAACRFCQEKIGKGELRIGREQMFGMRRSPVYFHVGCYGKSDDYHPRMLELMVLKADTEVSREDIEGLAPVLPPTPQEDDDVPPLLERLLTLYDVVQGAREQAAAAQAERDAGRPQLKENVVEIPEGFFSS
jgi:hypothetical protein